MQVRLLSPLNDITQSLYSKLSFIVAALAKRKMVRLGQMFLWFMILSIPWHAAGTHPLMALHGIK